MRFALLIAARDLRQRIRDRSVVLFAVVAPLGLAVIFSQLLAGTSDFRAVYAVVDLDGGSLSKAFGDEVLAGLHDAGLATIEVRATEADARAVVESKAGEPGHADAAFVLPAGFTAAITAGTPTSIQILGARDASFKTEVARSVATRFANGVAGIQLAAATVGTLRGLPATGADLARIVQLAQQPVLALADSQASTRQLSSTTYYSAAMAILFLFFAAQSGLLSLFEERRQGTLARMLAGPIRPGSVLLGKALGSLGTGLVAMTLLVVATTATVGASWGPPVGVALVVLAAVLCAIGLTAFVTSFFRTVDGAGSANSAVAITLGILGGTFTSVTQAPDAMQAVSLVTPHAWFLRGLAEMQGGGSIADALPSIGVLLAMALVTGGIGFARSGRLVAAR